MATPLNYRYMPPEIDHALEVSEASVMLAHAERDQDLAASRLAPRLPPGRDPLRRRRRHGAELRGAARARAAAAGLAGAISGRPGHHLFHLGQHRQAQGRHAHLRDFRLVAGAGARAQRPPPTTSFCPAARPRTSAPFCSRSRRFRPARACSSRGLSMATSCCRCCARTARPCS